MHEMNDMDLETQDILHEIELVPMSYHETAQQAKKLAEVRQHRREAKDTVRVLSHLIEYVAGNEKVIQGLQRLLGEIRKEEQRLENRTYIPKSKAGKQAAQ